MSHITTKKIPPLWAVFIYLIGLAELHSGGGGELRIKQPKANNINNLHNNYRFFLYGSLYGYISPCFIQKFCYNLR